MRAWFTGTLPLIATIIWLFARRRSVSTSSVPEQPPSADALEAVVELRQNLARRARSRLLSFLIGLPIVLAAAAYGVWLIGHPGGSVAPFSPHKSLQEVHDQIAGIIPPEMSRNWAIAAMALTATLCVAISARSQTSSALHTQISVDFFRHYVDTMIFIIACSTAVITVCGWLSVTDRPSIGTMTLTTLAAFAIFGLASLPAEDSSPSGRVWRIAQYKRRQAALSHWRSVIDSKGVPAESEARIASQCYNYATRSGIVALANLLVTVAIILIARAFHSPAVFGLKWTTLFTPSLVGMISTLAIGYGAVTIWSAYLVKHERVHFILPPAISAVLWGAFAALAIAGIALRGAIEIAVLTGFYFIGVPAMLVLLLRLSRSGRVGRTQQFARWMASPVWQQVHTRINREFRAINAGLEYEAENSRQLHINEIGTIEMLNANR